MDVKISDVAFAAGVSPATVSRVLNKNVNVNPETKKKVLDTIEQLKYIPNSAAKNLRIQRTSMIGVIVPDINSAYYAEIIKGIENMAYVHKYRVIICDSENSAEKEREYLNLLTDRTVDGMILNTPQISDSEMINLADKGYHIGVVGRQIKHEALACVCVDNIKLSRDVVAHLAERGHRDIVFLSGYADSVDSYERLEGYREGLSEAGISFQEVLTENGNFNEDGGYKAMLRLLDKRLSFSAVYAANDEMALGVYKACFERGLRIPDDIAVVGVDNNRISRYLTPTLSTVNQPKYMIGKLLMEKLIDQMTNKKILGQREFKLDGELIVRESSSARHG